MKNLKKLFFIFLIIGPYIYLYSQVREYRIHNRGILHETVFNTGEIGRAWQTGEAGNETSVPLMEWPSYSRTILDGIEYSGQHNIIGAGVYIGANKEGLPGKSNRLFALCGAVGASDPEVAIGRWSFPLYMEEIENFPLNSDGSLNENYNPNEAEEIISAGWSTPTGISVYRTSRAWSYPDYDDLIIYEYEFEYTGDTDGDPSTIEMNDKLKDVMICFNYGLYPSMYGAQRVYLEWKYEGGLYRGDVNNFWDADYWLTWNMNLRNNITDENGMAKPEPNPDYFRQFTQSGEHGGGLNSPQAPGYCILYYDTTHLAVVIPQEMDTFGLNESETQAILRSTTVTSLSQYSGIDIYTETTGGYKWYYELDKNYHIRQPWCNKVSTGNTNSEKMMYEKEPFNPSTRWSGVYSPGSLTWPEVKSDDWYGRAAYPYRQSADAGMRLHTFGPYTLKHGDKIRLAYAEVIGYGAQEGKRVEGGQTATQWAKIPSLNRKVVYKDSRGNETVLTEHYIDDFGYPDYVNSNIITVHDVARKAFEAYLGNEPVVPVQPEKHPSRGTYSVPTPPPAPVISIKNYGLAEVKITWGRAQEQFTHPRLTGELAKYMVQRAVSGIGPWITLDTIDVGDNEHLNENDEYEYIDSDPTYNVGEFRYYAVVSVDEHGNKSGKTNMTCFQKNIPAVEKIDKVYVVPNPFICKSGFTTEGDERMIGFYGLPDVCTIRVFSYSGQLIDTIEHKNSAYSHEKMLVTRNNQDMASGIYFYVVTTPEGEKSFGKFIILK